jgi:hypothetical protein
VSTRKISSHYFHFVVDFHAVQTAAAAVCLRKIHAVLEEKSTKENWHYLRPKWLGFVLKNHRAVLGTIFDERLPQHSACQSDFRG